MQRVFAPRNVLNCLVYLAAAWSGVAIAQAPPLVADASGVPSLTRFTAEHYSVMPQHTAVVTDRTGRVFVGNVEGLLLYSAGRFEPVPATQEMSVRSIALAADGRVLVGGFDQFGYFTEQADGTWKYTDLDERFRDVADAHPIGSVWMVTELPDGIYVQAARRLFRIAKDGRAESWPNPANALTALRVGDEIWARFEGLGLMRFTGSGFELVPGGEEFIRYGVQSSVAHPDGTLFTSRQNGLFIGDAKSGLRHIDTAYDDWLRSTQAYTVAALADGDFAVATLSGEVAIVDRAFALKKRYRISNYPITDVFQSVDGGLWFATEGDLVRLEWPSPWTYVGEEDGLFGALSDAEWFEGSRWVATSLGMFHSTTDAEGRVRFVPLPWAKDEVWDLQPVADEMLVGERRSVLVVRNGTPTKIAESPTGAYDMVVSTEVPGRVLVLEDTSILEIQHDGSWREGPRFDLGDVSVSTVVELDADHWLVGNWRGFPQLAVRESDANGVRLRLKALGPADGLPASAETGSSVWRLDGKVYTTIGDDLFEYQGERFVAAQDHPLVKLAGARLNEIEFRSGQKHQFAFTSREVWMQHGAEWRPLRLESRRAIGLTELSISRDARLTVVGWGGLLTFDPALAEISASDFNLRMHRVTLTDADRQTRLLDRSGTASIELPPLDGLRFEYGIDGHDSAVEFRTMLEGGGLTAEWSEWTPAPQREFTRLAPGDYKMKVEARTRSGRGNIDALHYAFRVMPRWYQTRAAGWAAAALVLALGSGLAWAWGGYRSRKLHERNVELEREVAAHTRELEIANQRLSKLAVQDGLTGITNRRGFEQFYAKVWNRLAEQRQPLAVLMIDVDYFKQYNDQHGHLLGDEMLRGIARVLEGLVHEPKELLARFGGEEFVMVLPGVDAEEANMRAHAVRAKCEEFGRDKEVTVSVGVAVCVPRGGLKSTQLLDESDAALYRAKKLGRNRVERGRMI